MEERELLEQLYANGALDNIEAPDDGNIPSQEADYAECQ